MLITSKEYLHSTILPGIYVPELAILTHQIHYYTRWHKSCSLFCLTLIHCFFSFLLIIIDFFRVPYQNASFHPKAERFRGWSSSSAALLAQVNRKGRANHRSSMLTFITSWVFRMWGVGLLPLSLCPSLGAGKEWRLAWEWVVHGASQVP